jgi:endonuclease YncB( thermonuclease family)
MKTNIFRTVVVLSLMICSQLPAKAATLQAKVTQVDSGNFLVVSNINRPLRIKLKAIEPPESGQPFSDVARDHLKALVFDKAVAVEYTHMASGYLEAKVFLNGIDIGSQMLRDGVAWYNRSAEYTLSQADRDLYMQCEQAARNEKRGLWQDSSAVAPWQFRRDQEAKLAKLNTQLESPLAAPRQSLRRSPKQTNPGLGSNDLLNSAMGAGLAADGSSLSAISENGTPDRWTTFESIAGHFSVSIPSNAIEKSSEISDPSGRPLAVQLVAGGGPQGFFSLTRIKGPDGDDDDSAAIESVIRSIIAGMNDAATHHYEFEKVLTVKLIRQLKLGNYYGKQYSLTSKAVSGSARVFTKQNGDNREFYVLMALVPPGSESAAAQFLNSFRIK